MSPEHVFESYLFHRGVLNHAYCQVVKHLYTDQIIFLVTDTFSKWQYWLGENLQLYYLN